MQNISEDKKVFDKKEGIGKLSTKTIFVVLIFLLFAEGLFLLGTMHERDAYKNMYDELKGNNQELLNRWVSFDMNPGTTYDLSKVKECWFELVENPEAEKRISTNIRVWNVTMPGGQWTDCHILKERCNDSFEPLKCKWNEKYFTCECNA